MSAEAGTGVAVGFDLRTVRVLRYAAGITLALGVALAVDWPLSYLSAVLALSFLATPDPCPTLRQGVAFVSVTAMASLFGFALARWLLPYPLVFLPLVALALFRLFYAKAGGISPLLVMWMLVGVLLIPLVALLSPELAGRVTVLVPTGAAAALLYVWITYLFFPDPPGVVVTRKPAPPAPSPEERLRNAATTTLVVLPVFILFYTLELAGSILILIFVALLSSQPGFAKNFRGGMALLLGNALGGGVAVILYELLVLMPEFGFLLLLVFLGGLVFGARVFSGKPSGPLYAMAFSTVVLILGSTTSGNAEAGGKVVTRIVQILVAVVYVVTAFGVLERFRGRKVPS
jgi:hypothetical protein